MDTSLNKTRRAFIKNIALAGIAASVPNILFASEYVDAEKKSSNLFSGKGYKDLVFLFQGDSITDGKRGRNQDPNHIMGHGYAFSIASRVGADFPEKNLTFINRGISGNKVTDLAGRWQEDTLDLKPNVLSILVGVNDSSSVINNKDAVSIEQYKETYTSLLDQTRKQYPDVLFVLCQPFIVPVGKIKENWDAWYADISERQKVVKELAVKYNAVFVPFQDVFNKALNKASADYWIWDGIHPTVAGHELMTREWIKQVRKRLKFLR